MARALRLAPDAVVVRPRFDVYADVSGRVFDILQTVTPLYEPLSLDEAFLDVTASRSLFGTPAEIARQLRRRIADELGLPASAGIAACKLVAKIASDLAKPNGQLEVAGRRRRRLSRAAAGGAAAGDRAQEREASSTRWGSPPSASWRPRGWPFSSSGSGPAAAISGSARRASTRAR